jgi:hypothetical protein
VRCQGSAWRGEGMRHRGRPAAGSAGSAVSASTAAVHDEERGVPWSGH